MKTALFVGCLCLVLSAAFVLSGCGNGGDQAVAGTQTTCPVMGGKINKKYYEDYQGKRVYFCCPDCPKKFKANPAKYTKKMADEGITLEDTPE